VTPAAVVSARTAAELVGVFALLALIVWYSEIRP